jgi:hypothetical protein
VAVGNKKILAENGWILSEILLRAIKTIDPAAKFDAL